MAKPVKLVTPNGGAEIEVEEFTKYYKELGFKIVSESKTPAKKESK